MPNIGAMMKFMEMRGKFNRNHPKFSAFLNAAGPYMGEGSVIEIGVTDSAGRKIETNLKLNAEDLEMLEALKQIKP